MELIDTKIIEFKGISETIDPLADRNSVKKCENLEPHIRPGIMTLRPPYQLKYEAPTETLDRLVGATPISFDNFYEKNAADGTEVTVLVQTSRIKAPSNVSGVAYQFNSVNIWMRPYFNGVYWEDKWDWLNETIITKLTAAPDSTYTNKITIQGKFGNLAQWVAVNVIRDTTLPASVLYSEEGVTDTTIWISNYENLWQSGDTIVLMKNYIPLKYLVEMNAVDQRQISFHRLPSKMRIGFGGWENRIGLAIEFVHRTLQMADYFIGVDPKLVGKESVFATSKRMIVEPYTLINEEQRTYTCYPIPYSGSLAAQKYYFRMTGVLDDTNEILVYEFTYEALTTLKIFPVPSFLLGALSRRLSSLKIYFSTDNAAFYLFTEYVVSLSGDTIVSPTFGLYLNGQYSYKQAATIGTNIYVNDHSAATPTNDNSIGSFATWDSRVLVLVTGATPYYVSAKNNSAADIYMAEMYLPASALDAAIQSNTSYGFTITAKATKAGTFIFYIQVSTNPSLTVSKTFTVGTTDATFTFNMSTPDYSKEVSPSINFGFQWIPSAGVFPTESFDLKAFAIAETQSNYLDATTVLGAQDIIEMGYTPSLNIVKDWSAGLVLNGVTYVAAGFIEKRYANLIFFSPISGAGASENDVLTAGNFLDSDKDSFRGEAIIAITSLLNMQLMVLTEGGGVIIDPSTGQTREVARGYPIMTKESLQKFRDTVYWGSDRDLVKISAQSGYNAEELSTFSVRRIYNAITDKTLVTSAIDIYGVYHLFLGAAESPKELLLTDRGWIDQSRDHNPVILRNGFMNIVWFMSEVGNIYSIPVNLTEQVGFADIYAKSYKEW